MKKMKILIAYDGSSHAEAALDDLARAGLPEEAEAPVLSVADVWAWPSPKDDDREARAQGLDIVGLNKARFEGRMKSGAKFFPIAAGYNAASAPQTIRFRLFSPARPLLRRSTRSLL